MPRTTHGMHGSIATRVPGIPMTVGPGLDHGSSDLVAENERECAQRHQGRGRSCVVGEEMEIAAADPADRHRDACPGRPRQVRLGKVDKRGRESRVREIELNGPHALSVRGQPRQRDLPGSGTCPPRIIRSGAGVRC